MTEETKTVAQQEAYEDLAIAIIKTAVDDYTMAKITVMRKKAKAQYCGAELAMIDRIESFFHSEYFNIISPIDGDMLLHRVNEGIENRYTKVLSRKNCSKVYKSELD